MLYIFYIQQSHNGMVFAFISLWLKTCWCMHHMKVVDFSVYNYGIHSFCSNNFSIFIWFCFFVSDSVSTRFENIVFVSSKYYYNIYSEWNEILSKQTNRNIRIRQYIRIAIERSTFQFKWIVVFFALSFMKKKINSFVY